MKNRKRKEQTDTTHQLWKPVLEIMSEEKWKLALLSKTKLKLLRGCIEPVVATWNMVVTGSHVAATISSGTSPKRSTNVRCVRE